MSKRRKQGSGTVRKRSDGRWEARVVVDYDEKGLPKTKTAVAKTRRECMDKLKALQEEYGPPVTKCKPDMSVGQWMDFWYQTYCKPALKPYTQTTYEQRIYNQIIPKIGNIPLNQVTTGTLEKFYAHLKSDGRLVRREQFGAGLANSVIRSIHAHCRAALEKAKKENLIRQNPAVQSSLQSPSYLREASYKSTSPPPRLEIYTSLCVTRTETRQRPASCLEIVTTEA